MCCRAGDDWDIWDIWGGGLGQKRKTKNEKRKTKTKNENEKSVHTTKYVCLFLWINSARPFAGRKIRLYYSLCCFIRLFVSINREVKRATW